MVGKDLKLYDKEKSQEARVRETAAKTKDALDRIVSAKLHNDKITTLSSGSTNDGSTYVRYTSSQIGNVAGGEQVPKQRIIKITDEKLDPMLPSSFKIRKVPAGPQNDAVVPILHDEINADKLTKAEQKKWQIAPSVSNWKNTKGFIIGIDNRLQNSGGNHEMSAADVEKSTQRFTALSDALKNAETKAKQDLKARASWRKRKESEQNMETQARLSRLAEEARNSRKTSQLPQDDTPRNTETDGSSSSSLSSKLQIRAERRRRAEEELKAEKLSTRQKVRKLATEQGREVSERVVIGVSEALKKKQKESVYDSDLYLKSTSSTSTVNDDKVYDTPLFSQEAALNDVYRTRNLPGYSGLGSKGNREDSGSSSAVAFVKDSEQENNDKSTTGH